MLVGIVMQVRIVMLASKDSNAGKEAVMLVRIHSKNDYVKMTHFVKMTYCQGNKSMLLLHTSSYYNKVMLH